MAGVVLLLADGVRTREHLNTILRVLVGLTAVMAFTGILQYFRIVDVTRYIRIPGLTANRDLFGAGVRGATDLTRVAGTANHYIEFGVVLAVVLPLALHFALFAPTGRKLIAWCQVGLIGAAIPMSISRSAILTTVVAIALLFMVWKWRLRYNAAVIGLVALTALHFLTRGLFGTIISLFRHADDDPSIQNRISDQAFVYEMWSQRPILGRGAGMILPDRYLLLDNQIFVTLIGGGILGVVALISLFIVPYMMARSVRLRAVTEEGRHLGQALAAALPAALMASFTFDALSFATFTGLVFVLVGVVGALWRLQGDRGERTLEWSPDDRCVAPPAFAPGHPRWSTRFLAKRSSPAS
ncbi:O-antigen ligase family protein [Microlunatus phosphovorus]|nr:O-antigen ligase family protein [Microlunatus phosphovorus]